MVNSYKVPKLPLPTPILGSEAGSFAEFTVTQRMPAIARRVIVENNFPPEINLRLERLAIELPTGTLPPLLNEKCEDFPAWDIYLESYKNQRWIDVPWFFAETYFYRLILEITHYFHPGVWQAIDPFQLQKSQGLEASLDSTILLCTQLKKWLEDSEIDSSPNKTALIALLYFALWGNRVDLSLWSAFEDDRSSFDIQNQLAHILVNDAEQISELLTISQGGRIDFVMDNAGFELVCDLCLVDFLLSSKLVNQVYLHLKPHPTFVSDAMIKDVHDTTSFLAATSHQQVTSFAQRLEEHIASGRLALSEDYFWTSPLAFWEIPSSVNDELANASLIIVKGDANYRRLLGDRHWNITTSFADIVCYLPVPIGALRTLKSEVAVGLKSEIVEKVAKSDHSWLTNGQWGVIQFAHCVPEN
ncbi:damage-control phosphatase ARMT1 family protein [Nostoc sp. UHCC 0252]|uniref:damage-control phosphatase ARMT1 family protein n=1 Tax=Nostoc sp. UHCC 0252 TaxID=3110241 RepID=UPI002B21015F|nr:damage-control phosphatase ARMT1 family protein [Nostoc sp. UHCC 0252]MEA5603478.1 damage-control phosphatase ARMT1 family protein [Nostoc sp. UHCC 0252]